MTESSPAPSWFGVHTLEPGTTLTLTLGPLELRARREAREWALTAVSDRALSERPADLTVDDAPLHADPEIVHRFAFTDPPAALTLTPLLADRPVIIRPERPLTLLPGEQARGYLSTPTWIRVSVGNPPRPLTELPSLRPSDTWFGPSMREGVLCYAASTRLRLDLNLAAIPAHRVMTPIVLVSGGDHPTTVARLRLPTRQLSIFQGPGHTLWTERVTLLDETTDGTSQVTLDKGPPLESEGGRLLSGPRDIRTTTFSLRAIESVLKLT
ncbi:MAG: hypothetical protein H6739_01130 [Alphaproteobacteria bacterium]|nr:hypothetical protein [Alphaproteobacteria bacterium]